MNFQTRLKAFQELGKQIKSLLDSGGFDAVIQKQSIENKWFTKENIRFALRAIIKMLDSESIELFSHKYGYYFRREKRRKIIDQKIAVISAGNIPCAAFHDFFCILVSGNHYVGKLSQQDLCLLPFIRKILLKIEPEFTGKISFHDKLPPFDKIITTGSNNSARYFEYYFKNKPTLLRKNRNSIAILNGKETLVDLRKLTVDIFQYFGLGCRSISKIFVPKGYDFNKIIGKCQVKSNRLMLHHGYANNYEYHRCIFAMNQTPYIDGFSFLLTPNEAIASPISVIYYEEYETINEILEVVNQHKNELQCVVSKDATLTQSVSFGNTQYPTLIDFPDNRDTILFCIF